MAKIPTKRKNSINDPSFSPLLSLSIHIIHINYHHNNFIYFHTSIIEILSILKPQQFNLSIRSPNSHKLIFMIICQTKQRLIIFLHMNSHIINTFKSSYIPYPQCTIMTTRNQFYRLTIP
jgi:hypothetical protein